MLLVSVNARSSGGARESAGRPLALVRALRALGPALLACAALACSGHITDPEQQSPAGEASSTPQLGDESDQEVPGDSELGGEAGGDPSADPFEPDEPQSSEAPGLPVGEEEEEEAEASNPQETARPSREYCDAMETVFHVNCGNGSCHSNVGANIGDFAIDLNHARNYVDRVSVRDPSCGLVIDSENPLQSLMLTKVTGNFPSGCGGIMPVGSFDVTQEQIACLADWVLQFQR